MSKAKLSWELAKRKPRYIWQKGKTQTRTRASMINEAIHKLLVIKKRRIEENQPAKKIKACQDEIDKLVKLRRVYDQADKFIEWKNRRGVQ